GELNSIKRFFDIEDIIDSDGKEYEKRNLKYMKFNIEDVLLENPLLFKTPIVRSAKQVTIGYQPETWKKWQ
ncbi:MAG: ArsC/Spx/MgsR family protein, partial [candidate division Zixibacteria bacterium]|nr:ArsC/Spx/MgsR family protein [candidate division Zixibacteria bacterium]